MRPAPSPPPRRPRPAASRCAASAASSAPTGAPIAVVTAIIVASSVVGLASPFLLRAIIDTALPDRDLHLLAVLAGGMVAVAARHRRARRRADLGQHQASASSVMHGLRTDVFTHLQRQSIAFFTRTRTGEVQSRITNDIGGMQSVVTSTATSIASNLTTTVATAVAMVALSWRLVADLARRAPAGDLADPPGRADAPRDHRARSSASSPTSTSPSRRASRSTASQLTKTLGTGPALVDRFTASSARLIDLELRSQLAGRWRMASMSVIFAAIPAVIYLGAGLPDDRRHA